MNYITNDILNLVSAERGLRRLAGYAYLPGIRAMASGLQPPLFNAVSLDSGGEADRLGYWGACLSLGVLGPISIESLS